MNSPKLDAIGIEAICDRIESGESHQEIADTVGVSRPTLSAWLRSSTDYSARARAAMESSAEAWLEKGRQALLDSMKKSGDTDPHAAKAYAQECARLAAIRNAAFRERSEVTQINVTAQMSEDDLRAQLLALEARTGLLQRLGLQGRVLEHKPDDAIPPPPPAD